MTVTAVQGWSRDRATPLIRARNGENEAFAEIVKEHEAMVFSIALHSLRNRDQAEEIAQDVFLQLYRSLDKLDSAEHLTNWLRRATTHRVIDACRSASRAPRVSLDSVPEPAALPKEKDPFLRETLRELVGELPVKQRMAVILRFGEEMQLSEIAETLEMPLNTVKSNLRRGLERLRDLLTEGEDR